MPVDTRVAGKRIVFSRGTTDVRKCQFCRTDTNRVLASQLEGDPRWDMVWCCPQCHNTIMTIGVEIQKVGN